MEQDCCINSFPAPFLLIYGCKFQSLLISFCGNGALNQTITKTKRHLHHCKRRYFDMRIIYLWSCLTDSNRRPLPYQGSALPAELKQRINKISTILLYTVRVKKSIENSLFFTLRRNSALNSPRPSYKLRSLSYVLLSHARIPYDYAAFRHFLWHCPEIF